MNDFDAVWIDCLNGDKYRTGKLTPDGQPDPSVFSTAHNREGIQVGTAVALLVRKTDHTGSAVVRFRDLWGQQKRAALLASLQNLSPAAYQPLIPDRSLSLAMRPLGAQRQYLTWPSLADLFPVWFAGVKTSRDDVVVDIDRQRLEARMRDYYDPSMTDQEIAASAPARWPTLAPSKPPKRVPT